MKTTEIFDEIIEIMEESKPIKYGIYFVAGLVGIYILGHTFKILAHAINGYKELKSVIE